MLFKKYLSIILTVPSLMLTISVHHPQIQDFIKIKRDLTRVTGANVSVRLSDEFLNAVEAGEEYELRWPVDSSSPTVSKRVSACQIWDEIIHLTDFLH